MIFGIMIINFNDNLIGYIFDLQFYSKCISPSFKVPDRNSVFRNLNLDWIQCCRCLENWSTILKIIYDPPVTGRDKPTLADLGCRFSSSLLKYLNIWHDIFVIKRVKLQNTVIRCNQHWTNCFWFLAFQKNDDIRLIWR